MLSNKNNHLIKKFIKGGNTIIKQESSVPPDSFQKSLKEELKEDLKED